MPAESPVTFSVTDTTRIFLDGKTASLDGLSISDLCQAEGETTSAGTVANEIDATTPQVFGTITAIDSATDVITVQPPSPPFQKTAVPAVQLQITDSTDIMKMGTSSFADLLVGDVVWASYLTSAGTPTALDVTVQPLNFAGSVVSVDTTGGAITIAERQGNACFQCGKRHKDIPEWQVRGTGGNFAERLCGRSVLPVQQRQHGSYNRCPRTDKSRPGLEGL